VNTRLSRGSCVAVDATITMRSLGAVPHQQEDAMEGMSRRQTFPVSDEVFRAVYDSPHSLPGKERWVTPDADVRKIEELLGIPAESIGAPLWVSGDSRSCPACRRALSWLDIVASGLARRHDRRMVAAVILGDQKYVNVEAPNAISGVRCFDCGSEISDMRSFKCHNWAYAIGDIERVVNSIV
jgi:hypothetical protein